jgi:lysyl-tRNA synthetase class 1
MTGSRKVAVDDIPIYLKELDYLEDVYFGKIKEINPSRKRKMKGLYEYCWHLKPPEKRSIHIPYSLLVNLISVAPESAFEDFLESRLIEYGYLRDGAKIGDVEDRIQYASNWVRDFAQLEEVTIELDEKQRASLNDLVKSIEGLDEADEIQSRIFETAKLNEMKPRDFFRLLYQILLNADRGPKLGPYIQTIGTEHAILTIKKNLD